MPFIEQEQPMLFKERRNELIRMIREQHPHKDGIVVLFGNFEQDGHPFKQERSFYYFTGIKEPAAALTINLDTNASTLYVPNFGKERAKWVEATILPSPEHAASLGFDAIHYLGNPCKGYQCHPFFTSHEYQTLLHDLSQYLQQGKVLFTLNPTSSYEYLEQRFILQRINDIMPTSKQVFTDISSLVAQMRRKKSNRELELLYKAVDITIDAQTVAARMLAQGKIEYEVQGMIEYIFTASGGSLAFPSIVASGINGTVLHYTSNNKSLEYGELVVIDIGAEYNYYCADITRTYPVSGTFTKRQRDVYKIVLETQEYIASIAKPGLWLSNKEHEDQSLHHLAKKFLKEKGYDHYFIHGIGHFLGLDVHDVGDYLRPLQPGDVITIEPGIYIPEEKLGIRIEDNYWIVPDGVICLSEDLPKQPDDIELMMQKKVDVEENLISEESEEGDEA